MDVKIEKDNGLLNAIITGRLDTNTAPELEMMVNNYLDNIKNLQFDLSNLDYISSAGLRVVLILHKHMASVGGKLNILSPKDEVLEVFDMTGFSTFLSIKE